MMRLITFLHIIFREERIALHNCLKYLQAHEFCKMFSKFKELRRGKIRELRQIADRKIYLVGRRSQ